MPPISQNCSYNWTSMSPIGHYNSYYWTSIHSNNSESWKYWTLNQYIFPGDIYKHPGPRPSRPPPVPAARPSGGPPGGAGGLLRIIITDWRHWGPIIKIVLTHWRHWGPIIGLRWFIGGIEVQYIALKVLRMDCVPVYCTHRPSKWLFSNISRIQNN